MEDGIAMMIKLNYWHPKLTKVLDGFVNSEFTNVVLRVLLYSGVVIRDPNIVQAAAGQIQKEEIQEKS